MTAGVALLAHVREAFGKDQHLATVSLLERLWERDELPWRDIYGKPLDDRGLAKRLKPYGIKSKTVRADGRTPKGYAIADFTDAWRRYLPPASDERHKGNGRHIFDKQNKFVADVMWRWGEEPEPGSFEPDDPFDLPDLPAFLDRRSTGMRELFDSGAAAAACIELDLTRHNDAPHCQAPKNSRPNGGRRFGKEPSTSKASRAPRSFGPSPARLPSSHGREALANDADAARLARKKEQDRLRQRRRRARISPRANGPLRISITI